MNHGRYVGDSMKLKRITLKDKEVFDKYFLNRNTYNSEFTFTNLFIWRDSYDVKFAEVLDSLCIFISNLYGERWFLFPVGVDLSDTDKIRKILGECLEYFNEIQIEPVFCLWHEELETVLSEIYPEEWDVLENRDDFDYVYNVRNMINLSGRKLRKKKNHINRFKREYCGRWKYRPLVLNDKDECMKLFEKWKSRKLTEKYGSYDPNIDFECACSNEMDKDDYISHESETKAIMELLGTWEQLDIVGGCIEVDGHMAAFSFGERLNDEYAVIHFEYADISYPGSFAIMNQEFLKNEWNSFKYIVREEDMGICGLRFAKMSYVPDHFVKKYIAVCK